MLAELDNSSCVASSDPSCRSRGLGLRFARRRRAPLIHRVVHRFYRKRTCPQPRDSRFFLFIDSGGDSASSSIGYELIGNISGWARQQVGVPTATPWGGLTATATHVNVFPLPFAIWPSGCQIPRSAC